jgi:acetyl esterase/lipase
VFTDPGISHEEKSIPSPNGGIPLVILQKQGSQSKERPAIYFLHAGGLIMGMRYTFLSAVFDWVKQLDAVVVSADYRLAPEHPSPAGFEDAYAGLKWTADQAVALGINPKKLVIAGASAGGCLGAAIALKIQDHGGLDLYGQMLIYPMVDDQCITSSLKQFASYGTWTGGALAYTARRRYCIASSARSLEVPVTNP